jgi:hypothetical protein
LRNLLPLSTHDTEQHQHITPDFPPGMAHHICRPPGTVFLQDHQEGGDEVWRPQNLIDKLLAPESQVDEYPHEGCECGRGWHAFQHMLYARQQLQNQD